ncbi:hypothetical protein ABKN59_000140 [Abortiporus biennis]
MQQVFHESSSQHKSHNRFPRALYIVILVTKALCFETTRVMGDLSDQHRRTILAPTKSPTLGWRFKLANDTMFRLTTRIYCSILNST